MINLNEVNDIIISKFNNFLYSDFYSLFKIIILIRNINENNEEKQFD